MEEPDDTPTMTDRWEQGDIKYGLGYRPLTLEDLKKKRENNT